MAATQGARGPGIRQVLPLSGGGGKRKRWKDDEGYIYEWDSAHGAVEKYDRRGRHLGEFNPVTGEKNKDADPVRRVEP
ncbi:hypothetical protein ELR50_03455 [Pseudomonas citronellolis]|nr:hypothetical protein ELR50_03455 [Pseudomonas citronellolis]